MKLLICDMDGTLVDSMHFLRELAVALLVADVGSTHIEEAMRRLYRETFGRPISEQYTEWNRAFGVSERQRVDVPRLVRMYESVHRLAAPNFPLMDFAREMSHLPKDAWKLALVSSTNKDIIDRMGQLRCIPWDHVGGYRGSGHVKTRQIADALTALDMQLNDVIYVGDAPSDRELARQLGIPYFFPTGPALHEIMGQKMFTGT